MTDWLHRQTEPGVLHGPQPRGRVRSCVRALVAAALICLAAVSGARADGPVKGDVRVFNDDGFTRLVFDLDQEIKTNVRLSWPIMVISFAKPVDVSVDRLNARAPDYISAARVDPDGRAIRIALARKVKINSIPAAERLYVDLLPDTWTGVMPGLPQEVIAQLADRAREAEHLLRRRNLITERRPPPNIRVKVASQPTFTRYVFAMPDGVNVVPQQTAGTLTLDFDHLITWDLADAIAAMPATVRSIAAAPDRSSVAVSFVLNGTPEARTFLEDNSIAVDISHDGAPQQPRAGQDAARPAAAAAPVLAPPESAPAEVAEQGGLPPMIDVPAPAEANEAGPPSNAPAAAKSAAPPSSGPAAAPVHAAPPADAGRMENPAMPRAAAAPVMSRPAVQGAPANDAAEMSRMERAPEPAAGPPEAAGDEPQGKMQKVAAGEAQMAAPAPAAAQDPAPTPAAPSDLSAPDTVAPATPAAAAEPPANAQGMLPAPRADGTVVVGVTRSADVLRMEFPFTAPAPAAAFRRGEMLWLVFDTDAGIDVSALIEQGGTIVRNARVTRGKDGEAIVRIRLGRPQLASLDTDGPAWLVTIGDKVTVPTTPLGAARTVIGQSRANIVIPFEQPAKLHQIRDPDIGDRLLVITAAGPARGFVRRQDFVELEVLASSHGVVVHPIADDVTADLDEAKIIIGRPDGLSLSTAISGKQQEAAIAGGASFRTMTFDPQMWGFDRKADFNARESELIRRAASAPTTRRQPARFNLARFYLAHGMSAEAKAVLDVARASQSGADDVTGSVLAAVANVMLGRPGEALKELSKPKVGNQLDAPIWRAVAYAREGRWAEARVGFKNVEAAVAALPLELQRMAMMDALRTAIEVRDFDSASRLITEFDTIGVPPELKPSFDVLVGRLDEDLGRGEDALTKYRAAALSSDRRAAAQGRLREIEMRAKLGDMPRGQVIKELETLTTVWRGDETEMEGLRLLARLYGKDGRYREAFHVMRSAMTAHPNSDLTRKIQDEAAETFNSLFLSNKGDSLPPIEALGLFYDYRELTPIGRRGDEMIRRLADRLVAVDLLDQAAELLQHQVDHRLNGAARAQVATRLAVIYLKNHKPDRALASLQSTRMAELANELREQRLLLEARALSDIGRHDVALEVIANINGPEAIRLRGDIQWAGQRWRQAGEQIELLYGERWKDFAPLNESERFDILRAAVGYALADDSIGLERFRDKYAPKMAEGPDRRAFDVVSAPIGTSNAAFNDVAKRVVSMDTLEAFLRDLRKRYAGADTIPPDGASGTEPAAGEPDAPPARAPGLSGAAPGTQSGANAATPHPATSPLPPNAPAKPDPAPTGSIPLSQGPAAR